MGKTLEEVQKLSSYEVFNYFDTDFEGACPCFGGTVIDDSGTVSVRGRCWRVSDNMGSSHQDLYVWGDHPELKKIARAVKKALDETEWYNPYKIIYEEMS